MKILAVKRLESSFTAFQKTLERFIASYERVIAEIQKGRVFISKKYSEKIAELLDSDDQAGIDRLLEEDKAEQLDAADFSPEFIVDLRSDLNVLNQIRALWKNVTRDPKWDSFREILQTDTTLKQGKMVIFTESKETAEYLVEKIQAEVEPKVLLFTGASPKGDRKAVIENFDARSYCQESDYRILVTTDILAEGMNLHRSNVVINYDIPWNPTRLIQRVGRVNRVDTTFEEIFTYNFFPTEEGNDIIKLKEAAETKIHAFIQMLGADAKLLTEGEEIVSHDLFDKLNSKKTLTGEDADEETELKYLTEIRRVRDENTKLFERIKRLPVKARSTRTFSKGAVSAKVSLPDFPALLTYFRQGRLDKFFLSVSGAGSAQELDFLSAANLLKPTDTKEPRRSIVSQEFYALLDSNKTGFRDVMESEIDLAESVFGGSPSDTYILRRLKAKSVSRCQKFTRDDENFVKRVIQLIEDGSLSKQTSKKVKSALEQPEALDPLSLLGVLRREISEKFLQDSDVSITESQSLSQREVILSSYFVLNRGDV